METRKKFTLLDYPGSQKSALWGMKDILDHANTHAEANGTAIFDTTISKAPNGKADVFVLPPALVLEPPELPVRWKELLIDQRNAGAVLASVCSGAFLLAETGLLDGRRVTTHWRHAKKFGELHPKSIVETERIVLDGDDIVTAGGVMAWTDLTLHMIQRFGGRKLMLDVARMFLLDPPEREQRYYATFIPFRNHSDQSVAAIQDLMQEELGSEHTVESLAAAGSMSERSLLRRFKQATGYTPMSYLQLLRVEGARSRLEMTRESFEKISWDLGYQDANTFRRLFKRALGVTPSEYRRRFGMGAVSQSTDVKERENGPDTTNHNGLSPIVPGRFSFS